MQIVENEGDFVTNVKRALDDIDSSFMDYPGIIICGTHSPDGLDEKIRMIKEAREKGIPFLGVCHGHQLACLEYCRNVLGIKDATSEEFGQEYGKSSTYVIKKLPGLRVGIQEVDGRMESFWNNYEIDSAILKQWKKPSWFFSTISS